MAVARKKSQTKKADPLLEAAVEYFSGRSHDAWRKRFHETNPAEKNLPRMRMRGGAMVDINKPWAKLDKRAKDDNRRAARDAYAAVKKFPNDREAASDFVHKAWIQRNKADKSLDRALFKPYAKLSEVEKDKDRAHVDNMTKAIAAVSKGARAKKAKTASSFKTVKIEAKSWARLEKAAAQLSKSMGANVTPEALLTAGLAAIVAVSGAVASPAKASKPKKT